MVLEASAAAAAKMKSKRHKALEDSDNFENSPEIDLRRRINMTRKNYQVAQEKTSSNTSRKKKVKPMCGTAPAAQLGDGLFT